MIQALLQEFEYEMGTTRKVLDVVPEKDFGWKPHDKSMALGVLAGHVAQIPGWTVSTFTTDELDVAGMKSEKLDTKAALLQEFDKNVKNSIETLKNVKPEQLSQPWALKYSGQVLFSMPKGGVFRTWVLNHIYHHRGQLSVYLRMRNVPLPKIYGPTADDQSF